MAIKVKRQTTKRSSQLQLRIHLEGLAQAAESLLNDNYPETNEILRDLKKNDEYMIFPDAEPGCGFCYEHKGKRYAVQIRRAI